MNIEVKKMNIDIKNSTKSNDRDYSMRGLARFGRNLFSAFLVWCTFNYSMSDEMKGWFFVWAVVTWLVS